MKRKTNRMCIAALLCIAVLLSACADVQQAEYVIPENMESVSETLLAQNGNYSLEWDDTSKCVFIRENSSDTVWSTTPYDFYLSGETNYNLCSPLNIEYYNSEDGSINTANASDCIDTNMVSAEKVENGIKVTYYFDIVEITVSATYTLRDDSLEISLNTDDFIEAGVNKLLNVSVAPYLCSLKNSDSKSDYLFIPSGSGALMYTDVEPGDNPRTFTGEVYGNDPVRAVLTYTGKEEAVRLPVFGAVTGGNAICAIIENGEGAGTVNAIAGNPRNGYSTVYASFNVRGYNNAELETSATIILNSGFPKSTEFSVGYYLLSGESASYNGFAALYRSYLENSGALKKSDEKQEAYQVTLIGGAEVNAYTLGIPHTDLLPLTTFDEAKAIIEDLKKNTEKIPQVILKGFGETGVNASKLAGGFKFSSKLGGNNDIEELEKYCKDNGIPIYVDFDVVFFAESGNGFNRSGDVAMSANLQKAVIYPIKRNTLEVQEDQEKTFLLSRARQEDAIDKLLDFSDGRFGGISLSSFGKTAYSDYSENKYMLKGSLAEQAKLIEKIKNKNHIVALSSANSYIAGIASSIYDVPLQNGGYDALDEMVPFYQIVYSGYIPMYSRGINLSANSQRQILRAVESGVSPSFVLTESYDSEISTSYTEIKSSVIYENNKKLIKQTVEKLDKYFRSVNGAAIAKHRIVQTGVTETVYTNGISVVVNHTDKSVNINGKDIAAMSFELGG